MKRRFLADVKKSSNFAGEKVMVIGEWRKAKVR